MSGLYNMLFGYNTACAFLLPMLTDEKPEKFFPRFRDCGLGSDRNSIVVFTRTGGGNREAYAEENAKIASLPTYRCDYDDDFDCTYAYFVYDVPKEWRNDFELLKDSRLDELSDAYLERIHKCFPSIDPKELVESFGNPNYKEA
jgi:hypothetical protein